ncbi:MAG: hypothetical protein H0U76_12155 [Ktedonobacteraceae bacterium]|nr:hypothetical protein [Ktedonobacteraceae bacterium]
MKRTLVFGCLLIPLIFLFAACGRADGNTSSSSTTTSGATSVQVDESDYKIVSSITTFTSGKSYHFEVKNNGSTAHELMIMPRAEGTMSGMGMGDMDKMALAKVENIAPGQSATLDYTFPASASGSHPELTCYYPGHYEAGMKQTVTVMP